MTGLLSDGSELIGGAGTFERLRLLWRDATFSEASPVQLERYFRYQLEGISKFSDTLYVSPSERGGALQDELLSAITHLLTYHRYPSITEIVAPYAYHIASLERLRERSVTLQASLAAAPVSVPLRSFLADVLQDVGMADLKGRTNFAALEYLSLTIEELSVLDLSGPTAESQIQLLFLDIDLNHLGVYNYLQQYHQLAVARLSMNEKLVYFTNALTAIKQRPVQSRYRYHPDWPSLKDMLIGFFGEEIDRLTVLQPKISLDISVAQLACLIASLQEEGVFGNTPIAEVIRFFAQNFSTKRRKVISAGSLSKEYYSIGQVTAAVLKDKFTRMAINIGRKFFPV